MSDSQPAVLLDEPEAVREMLLISVWGSLVIANKIAAEICPLCSSLVQPSNVEYNSKMHHINYHVTTARFLQR